MKPPAASTRPWIQFREPRGFHWTRADLPISNLPADLHGLRILHLTDVHFNGRWTPSHDELCRRIDEEKADLILLTGDIVESKVMPSPELPHIRKLAEHLTAPLGSFSILGNHDGDLVAPLLAGTNITLIDNGFRSIGRGESTIELVGLPGVHRGDVTAEVLATFPPKQTGALRIVLAHFPDQVRRIAGLNADVMLTGHTHGGQVCLPGGWPIVTHDSLPRKYCKGIHRSADLWLVVNRGFGFAGELPLRLFCPAEVMVLTLKKSEPQINADQRR